MSSIDDETLAKYLRTLKLENPDTSARAMLDSLHAMGCDIDLARVKKAAGKVVKALAKEKPLSPTSVVPQSASPVSRRGTPPTQKAVLKAEPAELLQILKEFATADAKYAALASMRLQVFIAPEEHEDERSPVKAACAVLLVDMGYCEAMVQVMRAHPETRRVQSMGCFFLTLLCKDYPVGVERAVECGAIDAVAGSITRHATDPEFDHVDYACRALCNLTDPELACANEFCAMAMRAHCHEVVIKAMRSSPFAKSAAMQLSACGFLQRLAWAKRGEGCGAVETTVEERRAALVKAGAYRALLTGALAAPAHQKLQDVVGSALSELSKGSGGKARDAEAKKEADRLGIDLE
jgi:hypothetical protein